MYDAFLELGPFESYVIDSSNHDPAATVETVRRGLDHGLFVLTGTGSS